MKFCPHCTEPILGWEITRPLNGNPRGAHVECVIRMCAGSAGHQRGECSCHNKIDTSEDGLTVREAAIAAYEEFNRQREPTQERI